MAEAHWYVVHTYSGYENKVKVRDIDRPSRIIIWKIRLARVRVPMQDVTG